MILKRTYTIYYDRNKQLFDNPESLKKLTVDLNSDPVITHVKMVPFFIGIWVGFEFESEKVGQRIPYFTYLLRAYLEQVHSVSMPAVPALFKLVYTDPANDPLMDAICKNNNRNRYTRLDRGLKWITNKQGETIISRKEIIYRKHFIGQ
jgi:hypothetical protein